MKPPSNYANHLCQKGAEACPEPFGFAQGKLREGWRGQGACVARRSSLSLPKGRHQARRVAPRSAVAGIPLLGSLCLIRRLWDGSASSVLPKYFPDRGDGKASLIHQCPELHGKLAHFVGRLGTVPAQPDLP